MDTNQVAHQKFSLEVFNLHTPAFLIDTSGIILTMNKASLELYHFNSPAKLINFSLANITSQHDFDAICGHIRAQETRANFPLIIQDPHRKHYCLSHISPCYNRHLSAVCAKLLLLEISKELYKAVTSENFHREQTCNVLAYT